MKNSTWTLGGDPSCDVWIRSSAVSPVHCRLNRHPSGFQVEDLGSSTGTTVNQTAVSQPTFCSPSDQIRLAGMLEMPWPDPSLARLAIRIGYATENDYLISHDEAVSGRHAMLVLDPNHQILLIDCESTNGTWIDNQRVKSAVISPHEPFQVGVTELTAGSVFEHTGHGHLIAAPQALEDNDATPTNRSDWWYAGILTAMLLVTGWTAWTLLRPGSNAGSDLVSRSETNSPAVVEAEPTLDDAGLLQPDSTEISDRDEPIQEETETMADQAFTQTPVVLNGVSNTLSSTVVDAQTGNEGSGISTAAGVSTEASVSTGAKVSTGARIEQSMYLIVIKTQTHQFDFAVAWEASPHVLLTNAHVIESLQNNRYQFFVVRVFDQWARVVESTGVHNAYRTCVAQLAESSDRAETVRAKIQQISKDGATQTEVEPLISRLRDIRRSEYWLRLKADCHDVGWIRVGSAAAEKSVYVPQQGRSPIQARKRLQLHHPSIESDAAYYEPDEPRDIGQLGVEVSELQITDDSSAPLSWVATFDPQPDDWKYFLFDGCPIVDLRGGVAGMYRGPVRTLSENPTEDESESFHFVSRTAIQQAIQQAESSQP